MLIHFGRCGDSKGHKRGVRCRSMVARIRRPARILFCIVALGTLAITACTEPQTSRELPLAPLDEQISVYGSLRVTPSPRGHAGFTLSVVGLDPTDTYRLCLNAEEADSSSSETLGNLGIPGWPLGAFHQAASGHEGYWDFENAQADAQGRYQKHFEIPLPAQSYRVKFLVKTNQGASARSILTSQPFMLEVRTPLGVHWLTGTIAAMAAVPLMFIVRGRTMRRVRTDVEGEEDRPLAPRSEHGPAEPELEPADVVLPGPLPFVGGMRTCVDRARAQGVLRHNKNYTWIEIHGRRKIFRQRQALVFRILCEQDPNCGGILQDDIVKDWEAVFHATRANPVRVRDIFRSCQGEPGDFIVRVPGPASAYRLRLEATPPIAAAECESDASDCGPLHYES